MNPLIGIAAGLVPDIIKLVAGDATGHLADQVGKAVADAVGTTNAGEAQTKLAANPAAEAALRQKLAELALDATKAQNADVGAAGSGGAQRYAKRAQRASGVGDDQQHDRLDRADHLLPRDRRLLRLPVCACLAVLGQAGRQSEQFHRSDHQYRRRRFDRGLRDGRQFLARVIRGIAKERRREPYVATGAGRPRQREHQGAAGQDRRTASGAG